MDNNQFLEIIRQRLKSIGCDDQLCEEWVEAANDYLVSFDDAELDAKNITEADADRLVDRIIESPQSALDDFFYGEIKVETASKPDLPVPTEAKPASLAAEVFDDDDDEPKKNNTRVIDTGFDAEDVPDERKVMRLAEENRRRDHQGVKGSPLFYILLILTAPLWIPIFIAVCVILGVLYVLLSVLIAALVIVMIALIGAGTAFSLINIVYGVIQLFSRMPVGLFEIGLGIILAGATMLFSILIYNLAVRLLPKLYKQITRFSKFVFRSISTLYYNAKKECGRK